MLDGKIVLCSHSDEAFSRLGEASVGKGSRYYNGGISQLSVFDTNLSPAHVAALYNQVYSCSQGRSGSWHLICILLCVLAPCTIFSWWACC